MRYRRNPPDMQILPQMDPFDEYEERMSSDEATDVLLAWKAAGSPKVSVRELVAAMTGRESR